MREAVPGAGRWTDPLGAQAAKEDGDGGCPGSIDG
jgi:hypothetical protein